MKQGKLIFFLLALFAFASSAFAQPEFHKRLPKGVPKTSVCGKLTGEIYGHGELIEYEIYQNTKEHRNCNVIRYRVGMLSLKGMGGIRAYEWQPEILYWQFPPELRVFFPKAKTARIFSLERRRNWKKLWLGKSRQWQEHKLIKQGGSSNIQEIRDDLSRRKNK